jgi:hypothetical protein
MADIVSQLINRLVNIIIIIIIIIIITTTTTGWGETEYLGSTALYSPIEQDPDNKWMTYEDGGELVELIILLLSSFLGSTAQFRTLASSTKSS